MSVEEKEMLQSIYAPTVVATPLEDARRSVCILPDGEIRCYGSIERDKKNILREADESHKDTFDKLYYRDTLAPLKCRVYLDNNDKIVYLMIIYFS